MRLFNSLFNKSKPDEPYIGLPENKLLLYYIAEWYKSSNDKTYKKAVMELMEGKTTLLLPSVNDELTIRKGWQTSDTDTSLKLTCIYEIDGLKVLGVFTDEEALLTWSQNHTEYVSLKSKDVLKICEENSISRLVINSNSYNMFVMQRSNDPSKPHNIPTGTTVMVGTPERPLPKSIIGKITAGFKANNNVREAYEYLNSYSGTYSLVIGIVLNADSEEGRSAAIFVVQNALQAVDLKEPVDIFFLQDAEWLQTIRQIPDSKFYG